ncbi:hypothetical protein CBFG_02005 [Clostridiales bacterium 1_7_47FAA]|nr:hypothetical protein CBFG_02005 [Clostridiales bacterium 1_7_47FAA]
MGIVLGCLGDGRILGAEGFWGADGDVMASVSGRGLGAVDTAAVLVVLGLWEPAKNKRLLP